MKKSEGPDLKKQIFVIGAGASGLMAVSYTHLTLPTTVPV